MRKRYAVPATAAFLIVASLSGCTTIAGGVAGLFGLKPVEQERLTTDKRTPITIGANAPENTIVEVGPFRGEFAWGEQEIVFLVNEERDAHGLEPLFIHGELATIARAHSDDMGKRGFYSHVNPDGTSPDERITAALSDRYYLTGTSENIAYRESSDGFADTPQEHLARQFMDGWMSSPGHRENILRADSTHIGVGLSRVGNRIYATQKFMSYIARLESISDGETLDADDPNIEFRLNPGIRNPRDLVVRVDLPDDTARWSTGDNRYYTGFGYVEPDWRDAMRFAVNLPVDTYGPGRYAIRLGNRGGTATQTRTFHFSVER